MAFENFEIGEVVEGAQCGTFRIKSFYRLAGLNCVFLKEVNPEDHNHEGPNPELAFTEDMIRKI